ncbi:MAG: hypothetical protein VX874_23635 [Pseudomonadota bacterium]|nr:hypothetical protein [Pseudomonadota bacterium]
MKSLYVHIGHYKTGTTAFQSYCASNAAGLARRGLLYPSAGRGPTAPTNHAGLSLPLAAAHGFHPPRWFTGTVDPSDAFEALHAEFAATPQRKALISSEEFVQLALRDDPEAAVAALSNNLARYRTRVIFTLREPMALLVSWYAQVSRGATPQGTFLDFAAGLNPDFLSQEPIRARFAGAFGARALRLIPYRGVGPWLKRRMLWSAGTIPYSRAALPIANVTGMVAEQERQRVEVQTAAQRADLGVTRTSLMALEARLSRINSDYHQLNRHVRVAPSMLTLEQVVEHYRRLVEPAAGQFALDPREADAMRELAREARTGEIEDTLLTIAALIDASQRHDDTRGAAWA